MANFIGTRRTDVFNGTDGDDFIDGGGGADTLKGGSGNDSIVYQNDSNRGSTMDGGEGNDTLVVRQGASFDLALGNQDTGSKSGTVSGFENVDASGSTAAVTLAGSAAANRLAGGAADDVLEGRGGADTLQGGAGNDTFVYRDAADSPSAGGRDTILDFVAGQDKIDLRQFAGSAALHWNGANAGPNGVWYEHSGTSVLVHADANGDGKADLTIELKDNSNLALGITDFLGVGQAVNSAPQARADANAATEDTTVQVSGNVLQNDTDPDAGSVLKVASPGTFAGQFGQLVIGADGNYTYTLNNAQANVQALAAGQTVHDVFTYRASDGALESQATLDIAVAGTNDAPVVSGAVSGSALEDGAAVVLNALANVTDVDTGASLAVVNVPASLPAGVSFNAAAKTFSLNPSAAAYQALAAGESTTVSVSYGVSDGAATSAATVSWTVTGTNDAPKVSGAVSGSAIEDGAAVTLNALANASDVDHGAVLKVVGVPSTLPAGVTYDAATGTFTLNPADPAYDALTQGQSTTVSVNYGISDGSATTGATVSWTIAGTGAANHAPVVSGAVAGTALEDGAIVALDALGNASDADAGATLSVVNVAGLPAGVTYDAATHTFALDPAHQAYQSLAQGQTRTVTVNYGVSDGQATTAASAAWTITGTNDAPVVSGAVSAGAFEDGGTVSLNALGKAADADSGSSLSVVGVPATLPDGVTWNPATNTFSLNASGAIYQSLAAGESTTVSVSYGVSDGIATTAATVSWTVNGTNDAPKVSGAVTGSALEDGSAVVIDALAKASDIDHGAVLKVTGLPNSLPAGVTYNAASATFSLDPSAWSYQALAAGQSTTVTVNYSVTDGATTTPASVAWTITGTNDAPVVSAGIPDLDLQGRAAFSYKLPDNAFADVDSGSVLTYSATLGDGAPLPTWLTVDAATGTFSGTAPDIDGIEPFSLQLTATDQAGSSVSETFVLRVIGGIVGTPEQDVLFGTGVGDRIYGLGSDDSLYGLEGDDMLDGGDGNDDLFGDIGNDKLVGGDGSDHLYGMDGNDQLLGGAGDDFLSDNDGVNSLYGGDGNDTIELYNPTATQAVIDGGAGNDVFHLYTRKFDQTITTGSGSDTIQLTSPEGTEQITVTDFTAGAGGDRVDLNDILSNSPAWDYASNPFTIGIVRLVQNGADTELQWDPDGAGGATGWDTLMVFQDTVATNFTGSNFLPNHNPDGSATGETITGSDSDDTLDGTMNNDIISGLGGNDTLYGWGGDDTLAGGTGDDYLYDYDGANSLYGGDGDDFIEFSAETTQVVVDGGSGNDTFEIHGRYADQTITTGSGADTIRFEFPWGDGIVTVTDFTPGAGGDLFDMNGSSEGSFLNYLDGWEYGVNPFAAGYLRLVQNGADTVLEVDQDAAGVDVTWSSLMVFKNTTVGSFTHDNFSPGYNPDGSGLGPTINGTEGDDELYGSMDSDIINGLGGADTLNGGYGNDQLHGDAGDDTLYGQDGDDTLDGGDGNDYLWDSDGVNSFQGGAGDDIIELWNNATQAVIDGGSGDDWITVYMRKFDQTVTTGSGSDIVGLSFPNEGSAIVTVTDFTTGADGDKVFLGNIPGSILDSLSGWVAGTDPFATGYLRLVQDGTSTDLQWDQDGAAGTAGWDTLIAFQNTDAASFTTENFEILLESPTLMAHLPVQAVTLVGAAEPAALLAG
jgi:VCBS repeat-containing protein